MLIDGQPLSRTIKDQEHNEDSTSSRPSTIYQPKKRKLLYYNSSDSDEEIPQHISSSIKVIKAVAAPQIIDLVDSDDEPEADPFPKRPRPSSSSLILKKSIPNTGSASSSSSSPMRAAVPGALEPMTMEKTVFSAKLVGGLSALDKCYGNERKAATTLSKKKTPKAAHKSGAGTGYGGVKGKHTWGTAGQTKKDLAARQKRDSAIDREKDMDESICCGLRSIRECIVEGLDTHSESTRFFLAEKLRSSDGFVWAVLMLLRNDDIGDIAKRQALYSELFQMVLALSQEVFACSVLSAELKEDGTIESQLESLNGVASTYMKMQEQNMNAATEDSEFKMSQMISDTWDSLRRGTLTARQVGIGIPSASFNHSSLSSSSPTPLTLEQKYAKVMTPRCFLGIQICGEIEHCYYDAPNSSSMIIPNPQRLKHISREIANLKRSLPVCWDSSIFVRFDEHSGRSDVLKVLVVGPSGTPYENGCFLFDIMLPASYPNVSPSVSLRTTGGGRVRFNPNLYADGKVCLSLLGTWEGEPWNPKKSTLLQVLVSIQGLILVAEPYYNEPGFERMVSNHQSDIYNHRVKIDTMQLAIYEQLLHPSPGFEAVIRDHFYLKKDRVREQLAALAVNQRASSQHELGHGWAMSERSIGTVGFASDSTSLTWKVHWELDKLRPSDDLAEVEQGGQVSGSSSTDVHGVDTPVQGGFGVGLLPTTREAEVDAKDEHDFLVQQRLKRFDTIPMGSNIGSSSGGASGSGVGWDYAGAALPADSAYDEDAELQRAIKMSMDECGGGGG